MSYSTENISLKRINTDTSLFDGGNIDAWESKTFSNLFYPYLWDNGGSDSIISLTIDVVSQNESIENFPNNNWHDKTRNNGNLNPQQTWIFKETYNPSKESPSSSNAFCFSGQELTFYIATQGHGTGYIDNQWLYLKRSLNVSVINVLTGETTSLKDFERFDSSIDDEERYFTWTVPTQDNDAFQDYGLFGMFVIRLEVDNICFYDAYMENEYTGQYPSKNLSLLHLLTYSAGKELYDVQTGGLTILDSAISEYEALDDIFSHTVFEGFESLNENGLTDSQKKAIVADQIAVVFASQHPVLTADYYPSKILGYGMKQGVRTETIINKAVSYSQRYPEVNELARDRLFGMLATVERFNFANELETLFPDHNQSNQIIRDPARIILVGEDGNLSDDLGVDGILLNPYVVETVGSSILFDVPYSLEFQVPIAQGSIDVDNITITREDLTSLQNGDGHVLVAFRVLSGESLINRIRYTLWTKNNLNQIEWVDVEGTSRSHLFDIEEKGNIEYNIDDGSQSDSSSSDSDSSDAVVGQDEEAEIVFCRIDIEDINGFVNYFYAERYIPDTLVSQGLTVIGALQRQDGSGIVDIYYDYFGKSEINSTFVSVSVSVDGESYDEIDNSALRGDIGLDVMPGRNRIIWYPYVTYTENYPSQVIIKLDVIDVDMNYNTGVQSNSAVLSLYKPEIAVRKVNAEEESGMWISSSSTESSSSSSIDSSSSSSTSVSSYSSSSSSEGYSSSSSS